MIYPASPAWLLIKNADYALARSLKMFPSGLKGNKRDIRIYNTRGGSPVSCLLCRRGCCFALFCSAATLFGWPKRRPNWWQTKFGPAAEQHFDLAMWLCLSRCRCLFASKRNERKLLADTLRKSHEKTLAHFDDVAVAVAISVDVSVAVDVNGGCETVRASLKVKKDFQRICEFRLCALCACCVETLQRQTEAINLHIYTHTHINTYVCQGESREATTVLHKKNKNNVGRLEKNNI